VPFVIGFAGFYDRWPWLSFAPFAVPLAVAPLVWFYTHVVVVGALPPRRWLDLTPAILQFAYQALSFMLPLALKTRWDTVSTPIVEPVVAVGWLVGLLGYSLASLALLRRYRAFLVDHRGDDDLYAARWLSRAIAAVLLLLAIRAGYQLVDLVHPLDYFGIVGFYFAVAVIGLYLGVEGWRHAGTPFPRLMPDPPVDPPRVRDWTAAGRDWAQRTRAENWQADPSLSLASLARLLGTNATYLSRALNEGLGVNFSTFVNGLRAEAVAELLRAGTNQDLLGIALDAGFSSKASFNRAFRAAYAMAPSDYRRRHGSKAAN
jgi:AraC-like DNA-binding protein